MRRRWGLGLAAVVIAGAAVAAEPPATSCTTCHGDAELFEGADLEIVSHFADDVHAAADLSCHDCHGGNPSLEVADDIEGAMDEGFAANPFRGAPARGDIPAFCGRCHSDPETMRRFAPAPRVDQEREYWTSVHGRRLRQGDQKVATCIDCHGVHGIRAVADPESPVHPTRVAETCGACHADPEHMAGYLKDDGSPLPTDQLAGWRRSVHARALLDKGDLSAPTCNDCHGNHGAAPPGVESIAFVCGHCHGREAELFRASPKHAGFVDHNGYLADAGDDGCAACHEAPEPQAALTGHRRLTECTTCHGNHAVVRPTLAMLGPLPDVPCAFCHEPTGDLAEVVPEPAAQQGHYETLKAQLLAEAAERGLEGAARFDWLVARALTLPTHTVAEAEGSGEAGAPTLRPEFERLFAKFRIGKTELTDRGPDGGEVVTPVVRCSDCHAAEPLLADAPVGHDTAAAFLDRMRRLTALTARAERIVLAARRGGVETQDALLEIDGAVDAQIELEVLLHGFDASDDGPFVKKQAEGLAHAAAALTAGERALGELAFRRRGLVASLGIIALVLIALVLKIRQLSRREAAAER